MEKIALKLEKSKEKITPFGGAVLIGDLFLKLRIDEYIDSKLPKPGSNRGYLPSFKILPLITTFMLGGSSFSDVDKFSSDMTLQKILNMEEIPESSTINRFYLSQKIQKDAIVADSKEIKTIGELCRLICLKLIKLSGLKEVTVDQDATYIKANKEEAKKCYKGYPGYSSLMSFISEIGSCIAEETRAGNVSPTSGLLEQLKEIKKYLEMIEVKLSRYRADSASYKSEIFNYCFCEGIEFFIGADLDRAVMEGIRNIDEESWSPYIDRYGVRSDREEVSEFIHTMNKTNKSFRMIVVREEIKENDKNKGIFKIYKYRAIATNSELPANEVVNYYNGRGICEYYIKEAKYGFNLKNLPSGNLESNGLWIKTGMLSYNLMLLLKHHGLDSGAKKLSLTNKMRKLNYKNKESKSIRYLIFSIAGKLVKRGRSLILQLCCGQDMLELLQNSRLELMQLNL